MGSLGWLVVGDLYWRAGWATAESLLQDMVGVRGETYVCNGKLGLGVAPGITWWAVVRQGDWMVWLPGAEAVLTRTRDRD